MSGFEVTYLGHQGWLFSAGDSRLLVDPLLTPAFGHLGGIGVVYPPRVFTWEAFPKIGALLLTHEHEDHFDIPSLARIDRAVPVLLSSRSSRAAHGILVEMGFEVQRVEPGDAVRIGDLELRLFAPELADVETTDEWDVVPFLVSDLRGHGSLFSAVDVPPHERMVTSLRAVLERPPAWCATNNATDMSFVRAGRVIETEATDSMALALAEMKDYARLCFGWGEPPFYMMGGSGFAFAGERSWMNGYAFRTSSAEVCAALRGVSPSRTFLAAEPGNTATLRDGVLEGVREETPFVRCEPRAAWPAREYVGEAPLLESYAPFTKARMLDEAELAELGRHLDGFAAHLCSRKLFRQLLSLERGDLEGRRPTFSMVLLTDTEGGAYVYEYDMAACAFTRVVGRDPVADYIGGFECWAADLLALFRVELAPAAVSFGRCRVWNAIPERCTVTPWELWMYVTPLRMPDAFLRFYRGLYDRCRSDSPEGVRASPGTLDRAT